MGLTIGQLADHLGITVRAIRHYHERGLLAEPERDLSGYRRYDADAVVDLVRIKVLVDAGVPLVRIRELIDADDDGFAAGVSDIDGMLQDRIGELERRRKQLAALAGGERMVLAADGVALLERLRAIGVSERTIHLERAGWILMTAMCPDMVPAWMAHKLAALEDGDFRRLYLACDEAASWEVDDPRLEALARRMADWRSIGAGSDLELPAVPAERRAAVTAAEALMAAQVDAQSPVWRRLNEIATAGVAGSPRR